MVDRSLKTGWRRVRFGDIVKLNQETSKDPAGDGLGRYVGLEHIEPGDLRIRSWGQIADGTTFTNRFRPGQVLFGKRRAYQRKVAVADFDGICSGDIYVLESRDPNLLLPELLPFICQTDGFFEHAVATSAGSLSPRTNWKSLAEYMFALPPPNEQRRVCRLLLATNAVVEEMGAAHRAAHGAYTAALLEVFAPGRKTNVGIAPKHSMPLNWDLVTLNSITDSRSPICYGIVQPGDSVAAGVPTATSNNLNIGFEKAIHLTSLDIERRYARSRIRGGDILVTVKGFGTGNIGTVPDFFMGNITRDIARIRVLAAPDARFLLHLWRSPPYERYWRALSVGTTRPELSIGTLREMEIPWPKESARERIASQLDELEAALWEISRRHKEAVGLINSAVAVVSSPALAWEQPVP